jgi:hypothetical protein
METYVETFGGMFWCFFNMELEKYPNLKRVVYNDFNPLNYNLFQCVQNPSELQRAMDNITVQQFGVEITPPEFREKFISFNLKYSERTLMFNRMTIQSLRSMFMSYPKFSVQQT